MNNLEQFYLQREEPNRGTLLALRNIILNQDREITTSLKYGMPFFCYKGKMFCYLWIHKKLNQPYIGFVEGKHLDENFLLQEKRSRMKIMLLDPNEDLPIHILNTLLQKVLKLYQTDTLLQKKPKGKKIA